MLNYITKVTPWPTFVLPAQSQKQWGKALLAASITTTKSRQHNTTQSLYHLEINFIIRRNIQKPSCKLLLVNKINQSPQ